MEKLIGREKAQLLNHFQPLKPGSEICENEKIIIVPQSRSSGFRYYFKRALPWFAFGVLLVLLVGSLVCIYNFGFISNRIKKNRCTTDHLKNSELQMYPTKNHDEIKHNQQKIVGNVKPALHGYFNEKKIIPEKDHQNILNWTMARQAYDEDQGCGDIKAEMVFADIDYALYGYNSLKGYPLTIGHDPGYTFPIFRADYSNNSKTSDCRYNVPKGLAVVPDISCVTSFSSKTVKTSNEFMSELGLSAGIEAGINGSGWGTSFSMSASYKSMQSKLENKERVYIFSNAQCKYYFCKIKTTNPPGFTDGFMTWVKKLDKSAAETDIMEFFDTYGTHFLVETEFGARYTYQYSMTSTQFYSKQSKVGNVKMAASYSGRFSLNAKLGLDSKQVQIAQEFMKDIDIKTYTVGAAPPEGGDAMKWASTVATDPVPLHYKMQSIENLFTETYMAKLEINYSKIYNAIIKTKYRYERYLKKKIQIEENRARRNNYFAFSGVLANSVYGESYVTVSDCLDDCFNDPDCKGFTRYENYCYFNYGQGNEKHLSVRFDNYYTSYTTYLLWKSGNETFCLDDSKINGNAMQTIKGLTQEQCEQKCLKHERCFAITYVTKTCRLYQKKQTRNIMNDKKDQSKTVIVPRNVNQELSLF